MNTNLGTQISNDASVFLDLFSTSQRFEGTPSQNLATCASEKCIKNAPLFAYQKEGKRYGIMQGCCNSWGCPRCGIMRAKQEYGRIVSGCRELSKTDELYFITITCKGREITHEQADASYGKWTNNLLTKWRGKCDRQGGKWNYVQVTERQKRGHPHSHILTTFRPHDVYEGIKGQWTSDNGGSKRWEEKKALRSTYLGRSIVGSGLGSQYDVSRVSSAEAVSRYVAKYLFKDTIFSTVWPSGWKRVRYSQSFPHLPNQPSNAFVLRAREDWQRLARLAISVTADSDHTKELAFSHLRGSDVLIR